MSEGEKISRPARLCIVVPRSSPPQNRRAKPGYRTTARPHRSCASAVDPPRRPGWTLSSDPAPRSILSVRAPSPRGAPRVSGPARTGPSVESAAHSCKSAYSRTAPTRSQCQPRSAGQVVDCLTGKETCEVGFVDSSLFFGQLLVTLIERASTAEVQGLVSERVNL